MNLEPERRRLALSLKETLDIEINEEDTEELAKEEEQVIILQSFNLKFGDVQNLEP